MLLIIIVGVSLLAGAVIALIARGFRLENTYGESMRITPLEYGIVSVAISLVTFLVVSVWGPDMARAHAAEGYKQFLNGSVVNVWTDPIECTRDGPCIHEYSCDPYNHVHHLTREVPSGTDANGNTTYRTEHYTEDHEHQRDCPYATYEYSHHVSFRTIDVETITIDSHVFAKDPEVWRPRDRKGIPRDVQRGPSERWQISYDRWHSGDAEPVTVVGTYVNYILPSEGTALKQYSGSVDRYLKTGLLLEHTQNLTGEVLYGAVPQARKAQFVGGLPADSDAWNDRLMRFNSVLGPTRQGDLHMVAMPAGAVSNPRDYLNALVAHWQSGLGKWGLPKNGIVLVVGVGNDGQIEWSQARTGMPQGNGSMLTALTLNLKGERFDPDILLGKVSAVPLFDDKGSLVLDKDGDTQFTYAGSDGIIGEIIFREYPFKRACMKKCDDPGDTGNSYEWMLGLIPIPTSAKVLWFFIVFVISLIGYGAALYWDPVVYFRDQLSGPRKRSAPTWR